MKNTVELLDAVRQRRGLTSDYQLAKLLEMSPNRVSNWRTGKNTMDNVAAMKIAELLERPALEVIALVEAERARDTKQRNFWLQVAAGAAAAIFVGVLATDQLALLPAFSAELCILCQLSIAAVLIALAAVWRRIVTDQAARRPARSLAALALILAASGCATPPAVTSAPAVVSVRWVQLEGGARARICGGDAAACFRIVGDVCTVYTRPARGPQDDELHSDLGHETRHCFAGFFH